MFLKKNLSCFKCSQHYQLLSCPKLYFIFTYQYIVLITHYKPKTNKVIFVPKPASSMFIIVIMITSYSARRWIRALLNQKITHNSHWTLWYHSKLVSALSLHEVLGDFLSKCDLTFMTLLFVYVAVSPHIQTVML